MNSTTDQILSKEYFEEITQFACGLLQSDEHIFLSFSSEHSQFIRLNAAKVRQIGVVCDSQLEISLIFESAPGLLHKGNRSLTLSGFTVEDQNLIKHELTLLKCEVRETPEDPYAQLPIRGESSSSVTKGILLKKERAVSEILEPFGKTDMAGIYASGISVRAMSNSAGLRHWFYTENFSFDYSLYTTTERALKGTYAGVKWDSDQFKKEIQSSEEHLSILERKPIKIPKGTYRVYLAPAAVAELISIFSWGAISEASIRQGDSPLRKLRTAEKIFSNKFSLSEDFLKIETPRFNSEGELAPEHLSLIQNGQLVHSLVSSRTSKEYKIPSNSALSSETLRAPLMSPGEVEESDILKQIGTGLYLSNLHYLNWSDQMGGRITGMTRYACFWVEKGKIEAPIESMRFDETLFELFGEGLIDFTKHQTYIPEVGSYGLRSLGGTWCPGMLVSKMNFTL